MPSGIYKRTKSHNKAISKAKIGHSVSEKTKLKISKANKGRIFSEQHKEKIKLRATGLVGKKARRWLGDKVGKIGVHLWLRREYGTPNFCEICKSTDKKIYDWASKDHKYARDRKKFMRLCRSCHRKYDIKNNNYKSKVTNLLK